MIILQLPFFFIAGQTQPENRSPNATTPIPNRTKKTHPTKNAHTLQATTNNTKNPPLAGLGVWLIVTCFWMPQNLFIMSKNLLLDSKLKHRGKRLTL
jgi:hypothetical protein